MTKVWNKHLHSGLIVLGWTQSKIDECIYYYNGVIFLFYVDDGIFASIDIEKIDTAIKELQQRYNMTDEGNVTDYLGIYFEKDSYDSIDEKIYLPISIVKTARKHPKSKKKATTP